MRKVFKWLAMPLLGMAISATGYPSSGLERRVNGPPTLNQLWANPTQFARESKGLLAPLPGTKPGIRRLFQDLSDFEGRSSIFRFEDDSNTVALMVLTNQYLWRMTVSWDTFKKAKDDPAFYEKNILRKVLTESPVSLQKTVLRQLAKTRQRASSLYTLFTYPQSKVSTERWLDSLRLNMTREAMMIVHEDTNFIGHTQWFGSSLKENPWMDRTVVRYYAKVGEELDFDVYTSIKGFGGKPIMSWPLPCEDLPK